MARPSKDNPKWKQKRQAYIEAVDSWKIQKLFNALKWWVSRDWAIVLAWLSRTSVYERMKKIENFRTKIEDNEELWVAFVENKLVWLVNNGYYPAIEKVLKSKKRDIYWDKVETDLNAKIDWDIKIKLPKA